MIELPEAVVLAGQMRRELVGRTVAGADCGNSPHKFAFYSRLKDRYADLMPGLRVTDVVARGNHVLLGLAPGYCLLLGDGGLRILLHERGATLPPKRQLHLELDDGRHLTASVRMWGMLQLLTEAQAEARVPPGLSPLDRGFTARRFAQGLRGYAEGESRSVKYYLISAHAVAGIGNGYLQDVLFRAGVSPMRKVAHLTGAECRRLHAAAVETLSQAVAAGGRDTERDLYGQPGSYRCLLDSRAAGKPCPACATKIVKKSYLGGSVYFCPRCQT